MECSRNIETSVFCLLRCRKLNELLKWLVVLQGYFYVKLFEQGSRRKDVNFKFQIRFLFHASKFTYSRHYCCP